MAFGEAKSLKSMILEGGGLGGQQWELVIAKEGNSTGKHLLTLRDIAREIFEDGS